MRKTVKGTTLYILALIGIICAFLLVGCGRNGSSEDLHGGDTLINQRQKEILAAEGLPADYDQLTESQKSAINAIESMLQYLEGKYGIPFEYYAYIPAGDMAQEQLSAVCNKGIVTVYRHYENGAFVWEDDYNEAAVEGVYAEKLNEYFSSVLDDTKFVIISDVFSVDGQTVENDVLGSTSASSWLFADESAVAAGELDGLVNAYVEWVKPLSAGQSTMLKICIVDSETLSAVNSLNYEEMAVGPQVVEKRMCAISKFGEVTII